MKTIYLPNRSSVSAQIRFGSFSPVYANECVIRTRRRVKWFGKPSSKEQQAQAMERLRTYHRKQRQHLVYISSAPDLWYIKRQMAGAKYLDRYTLTLIMAAMHRLSELSRYDPAGLLRYLEGKEKLASHGVYRARANSIHRRAGVRNDVIGIWISGY